MTDAEALELLAARRQELEAQQADLAPDSDEQTSLSALSSADQHPADIGTETADRTAALSMLDRVRAELRELDEAEERVRSGAYGRCEVCGGPIGEERLRALPATTRCLADAAAAERRLP